MDQLKQAIEDLREARQSYEALLSEFKSASEALEHLDSLVKTANERMLACEAQCTAIVREMSAEELPVEFR